MGSLASQRVRDRGSMASRKPSPRKLNPITAITMATEGAASVHQAVDASELDWLTISPRDAVGGGGPRPRKLRLASARTDHARARLVCTATMPATLGNMWRNRRRLRERA